MPCRPSSGLILLVAVLIEPWVIRRKLLPRLLRPAARPASRRRSTPARSRSRVPRTHGSDLAASEFNARGLRWFLTQRESAAVIFMVVLWLVGFWLRPDFWGKLDNSFNLLLAFTEIGLMAVGMTYVIANGDIDLSVGAVLALSGSTAAFLMKFMGWRPWPPGSAASSAGLLAGCLNGCSPPGCCCPPSSPRSACSTSRAASPPGWWRAASSASSRRATT